MTPEEALALLDMLLQGQKLNDIQVSVFCYSWQGWTYSTIAEHAGYDAGYIRDVGYELWQQLTQAFGEPVTKKNVQAVLRRQLHQRQSVSDQLTSPINTNSAGWTNKAKELSANKRQHWGEAIDVSVFYGRQEELALLEQWIVQDHCRLVALLGMGGIGKTALAVKLARQIQAEFEYVIWQSLRKALSS